MHNRDLDIRVAKEVMDWTGIHYGDILTSAIDPLFGYPPIDPRQPNAYGVLHHLPRYTDYLPAAWGIVTYLESKYKKLTWQSSGSENKIKFRFFIIDPISNEVEAESLSAAICLTALTIKKDIVCDGIYFQKQKSE